MPKAIPKTKQPAANTYRERLAQLLAETGAKEQLIESGYSRNMLYRILSGATVPSLTSADNLAAAAGVPLWVLLGPQKQYAAWLKANRD